jgi:DNA recombination protein RmuC
MDAFLNVNSLLPWLISAILLLVLIILFFRNPSTSSSDLSMSLQNLNMIIQQGQLELVKLSEKVSKVVPLTEELQNVQKDLSGLTEKIRTVETNQREANQGIGALSTGLVETQGKITSKVSGDLGNLRNESSNALTEIRKLTEGLNRTASLIQNSVATSQSELAKIQISLEERQRIQQRTAESINRLETIIAGTQSKGAAGENIVELVFSKLPADWQVRNFAVRGKTVEFGLRLPNDLILPIDSKWPATNLVEQFVAADAPEEQQRIKAAIESSVLQKAKEISKYIDSNTTLTFALAVVPDAVYDLCLRIQVDILRINVVLVSYSMFLPYLILVFQTTLKSAHSIDLHKLNAHLDSVHRCLTKLQEELDGRFSRAIKMLGNSRDEMMGQIGLAGSSITSLRAGSPNSAPDLTPIEHEND